MTAALLIGTASGCSGSSAASRPPAVASTATASSTPATPVKGSDTATGFIVWMNWKELVTLSDAQLETWRSHGATGFVAMTQGLFGLGGDEQFTGDRHDPLAAQDQDSQRSLRDSRIVARAKSHGMSVYLGFYLVNVFNTQTPLANWFDDAAWNDTVLPQVHAVASAAKILGCKGVAFDEELYPQQNGVQTATWNWDFPGNHEPEAAVRAAAKHRGQQVMAALLAGFPGVSIVDYGVRFPETWSAVLAESDGYKDAYADSVAPDFWDGLTSDPGYEQVLFLDAAFYKSPQLTPSWDDALAYEYRSFFSLLSRRLSAWPYAADRVAESPFGWIDNGKEDFERARSPAEVGAQLAAFHRWSMDSTYGLYEQQHLDGFDYGPYFPAIDSSVQPAVVDTKAPTIELSGAAKSLQRSTRATVLTGTVSDDFAVRVLRWQLNGGRSGTAQLGSVSGDPTSGGNPTLTWRISLPPLGSTTSSLLLTAESIKGLTASTRLSVGP